MPTQWNPLWEPVGAENTCIFSLASPLSCQAGQGLFSFDAKNHKPSSYPLPSHKSCLGEKHWQIMEITPPTITVNPSIRNDIVISMYIPLHFHVHDLIYFINSMKEVRSLAKGHNKSGRARIDPGNFLPPLCIDPALRPMPLTSSTWSPHPLNDTQANSSHGSSQRLPHCCSLDLDKGRIWHIKFYQKLRGSPVDTQTLVAD